MSTFDFARPNVVEYVYQLDKATRVRVAEGQATKTWYVRREVKEDEHWLEDLGTRKEFKNGLDAVKYATFLFKTNDPIFDVEVIKS